MLNELFKSRKSVEDFMKGYSTWYNRHGSNELDITNKELILYFIMEKSYNHDMMPRTLRKLVEGSTVSIDQGMKIAILKKIRDDIRDYIINGTDMPFDEWHKKICEKLLREVNMKLLDGKYYPIKYGKAQKIINMTFKYLTTCDNAEEYASRFDPCHMPLDNYILNWYYEKVKPDVKKSTRKAWSNLNADEYIAIQHDIRAYLGKQGKKALIEEWSIWPKYYGTQ